MIRQLKPLHRAIAALQRLSELFVERRQQLAREAGLTVPQWRLLEEIEGDDFMPSLFARRRSVTPAAVSKLIRGLLDRSLIGVSVSSEDGRQRHYALTVAGTRLLAKLKKNRQKAIDAVWRDLPVRDLDRFAEFGEELGDRLEAYQKTSHRIRQGRGTP